MSTEPATVCAERGKLNGELISAWMEVKRSPVTLAEMAAFVESLKRRMAAKEASFVRERKAFGAKLMEIISLTDTAFTETKARSDRHTDEVDAQSPMRWSLSAEVKRARRELTRARARNGILTE